MTSKDRAILLALRRDVLKLTPHQRDLLVPCPVRLCGAREGSECRAVDPGIVHFGRRVKRLLALRALNLPG